MRQRLSQAAFDVICEIGFANFRTSAVSKRAGVSQGAQLHHFPTKNSLAVAALEYAFQKSFETFQQNLATSAEGEELIDLILKDFADFYLSDYFMVALDILMGGGRNQELRDEITELSRKNRDTVERYWLERLVDDGWSLTMAEDVLALSHSLVRGFSTRALIREPGEKFTRLLNRWRTMVLSLREQPALGATVNAPIADPANAII